MLQKKRKRQHDRKHLRTHIFILVPSPYDERDTILEGAIHVLTNGPQEKLPFMEMHSFRTKTEQEMRDDNEAMLKREREREQLINENQIVPRYKRPFKLSEPGEVIWHRTSSDLPETPFLSMFLWIGKEHRFWKWHKKKIFVLENHPQVDSLVHLLEERRVTVRKVHVSELSSIMDEIEIKPIIKQEEE